MSREELGRVIAEIQVLDQLVQELQARIAVTESAVREYENALAFINEMKKAQGKMEVMISIGGGNYVYGEIKETGKVNVSVGAGVVITKSLEEGEQSIIKRKEAAERARELYRQRLQQYVARSQELRAHAERLAKEQKGETKQ